MVPGRPSTGRVVKDSSEWLVLLPSSAAQLTMVASQAFTSGVLQVA
jgi:hypothetical protein